MVEEGLPRGDRHRALTKLREWLIDHHDPSLPTINIAEVAGPARLIEGRTFAHARLCGPAVLGLDEDCAFLNDRWHGTPETIFVEGERDG